MSKIKDVEMFIPRSGLVISAMVVSIESFLLIRLINSHDCAIVDQL